jgi:hypothetical protein
MTAAQTHTNSAAPTRLQRSNTAALAPQTVERGQKNTTHALLRHEGVELLFVLEALQAVWHAVLVLDAQVLAERVGAVAVDLFFCCFVCWLFVVLLCWGGGG